MTFSIFFDGIGFGTEKMFIQKSIKFSFKHKIGTEKYNIQYQQILFKKSIGFGNENIWYKKVLNSVS